MLHHKENSFRRFYLQVFVVLSLLSTLIFTTAGYNITVAQITAPSTVNYGESISFNLDLVWENFTVPEDSTIFGSFQLIGVPIQNLACSSPSLCTIIGQSLSISYAPSNPTTDLSISFTVSGTLAASDSIYTSIVATLTAQITNTTTTAVSKLSDLGISINSVSTVVAGKSITYSITANNGGPSDAFGATVSDFWYTNNLFDLNQSGSWTCTPLDLGASCSPSSSTMNVVALVDLKVNSSVLIVLVAPVASSSTNTLNTNATIVIESGATEVLS